MRDVCIIAHDAGGAEILASYASRHPEIKKFSLAGPAIKIFHRRLGDFQNLAQQEAITTSDGILCGSGWQTDFERQALIHAKAIGKKSVTFLDHWANYEKRFLQGSRMILPDEIWVGDRYAAEIAKQKFPLTKIVQKANPYFDDIRADIDVVRKENLQTSLQNEFLFVCENIRDHRASMDKEDDMWGYDDDDAINFFFMNMNRLKTNGCKVMLRPHPSDKPGKYDWVKEKYPGQASLSRGQSLVEEILASEIVVGCESMAMIVAMLAGKRVVSCVPPHGAPCRLPHKEIEHLNKLEM